MYYYNLAVIGRKSPILSYHSEQSLECGEYVHVELKNKVVAAVVLQSCVTPHFSTKPIIQRLYTCLTPLQLKLAYFIASYYMCSLGESLQLFIPSTASPLLMDINRDYKLKSLSSHQDMALHNILPLDKALLFGETGSGKTEVYFHLIAHALKKGTQALFLMPEISLTPQIQQRLTQTFGDCVGIWHSKITKKKRAEILHKIQNGAIAILAGARSSLFLPMQKLSLIIVDEEHDDAYKSQKKPLYNAKDLALWLTQHKIKTILGSATPTASTYFKLHSHCFTLPSFYKESQRNIMFDIGCDEPSERTMDLLTQTLDKGKQVIIFLPTRANYKYIICQQCARTLQCPRCTLTLSMHIQSHKITCHHCNFSAPIPQSCPYCQHELILRRIGTKELQKRLIDKFPMYKIERLDKDSTNTASKLQAILSRFNDSKIQLLIGTQMIAKGHDYHNVELVVVLGIDYLLHSDDYRGRERVMSLLLQLCGRSGRKEHGNVIIQTGKKDFFEHYLHNYERFLTDEIRLRGDDYPPMARLAMLHIEHKSLDKCIEIFTHTLHLIEHNKGDVKIIFAGACPIEKLSNLWRYYILLSHKSAKKLHELLKKVLTKMHDLKKDHYILIDIDPIIFS